MVTCVYLNDAEQVKGSGGERGKKMGREDGSGVGDVNGEKTSFAKRNFNSFS